MQARRTLLRAPPPRNLRCLLFPCRCRTRFLSAWTSAASTFRREPDERREPFARDEDLFRHAEAPHPRRGVAARGPHLQPYRRARRLQGSRAWLPREELAGEQMTTRYEDEDFDD